MRLSFVAVVTDQQFRDLLIVRNECRAGLTHDTDELTLENQKVWRTHCWGGMAYETNKWYEPYLLYDDEWPIAYGLLKWDGQRYWMTAGIVKGYRGRGLSRVLINFITTMGYRASKVGIWLDAKDDNPGMFGYVREGYCFAQPEVWIDVMDGNPALFGDIKEGYEFVQQNAQKHDIIKGLHVMKHNRDRKLGQDEARWMKDHGRSVEEFDIVQEMIEVDKISRDADIA